MTKACNECGYPLNGTETTCPECGCPIMVEQTIGQQTTTSNASDSVYSSTGQEPDYDDLETIKEPILLAWIKPWHFSGKNPTEQASYNVLNDVSLLCNIILKIGLYVSVHLFIIYILWLLVSFVLMQAFNGINDISARVILLLIIAIPGSLLGGYIVIRAICKVVGIYWIPLLNVHRRIHARYWRAMYKEVKKQ